jgi:hypothetical protein
MPQVTSTALKEVETALAEYEFRVRMTGMSEWSVRTYVSHARSFVRWLADDFTPGERVPINPLPLPRPSSWTSRRDTAKRQTGSSPPH